jgi:hypothetical protein
MIQTIPVLATIMSLHSLGVYTMAMGPTSNVFTTQWQWDQQAMCSHLCVQVVLVLDQREQFSRSHAGQKLDRVAATKLRAEQMRAQGVAVEERTLSIGDVTWVAR